MRKIAIGDIHGCILTFKALLEQISFSKEDELFLLGDYIDRGPDSRGVIDHIRYLKEEGYRLNCLRGNHEQLLLDAVNRYDAEQLWQSNGGWATLHSFNVTNPLDIPADYLDFFLQLPYYYETDNYLLLHAGPGFHQPDPLEDKNTLIWIRDWYEDIDMEWLGHRIIVHGHTPVPAATIKESLGTLAQQPAINIDAGCVHNRLGLHQLCALDMTNRKLYFQENVENN